MVAERKEDAELEEARHVEKDRQEAQRAEAARTRKEAARRAEAQELEALALTTTLPLTLTLTLGPAAGGCKAEEGGRCQGRGCSSRRMVGNIEGGARVPPHR